VAPVPFTILCFVNVNSTVDKKSVRLTRDNHEGTVQKLTILPACFASFSLWNAQMGLLRYMNYSAENVVQISQLHADWNWCFNPHVLAHLKSRYFYSYFFLANK